MDTLDLTSYIELIGNVGFPILIALILLRTLLDSFNKRLDSLDKRLTQLNKTITLIIKALDKENRNVETTKHVQNDSKDM
ncbi:hypothetical protein SAMN05444162_1462 [Paenibacillaceae bacterium GAS479]|nr:hypothetical protein SAMN05444162_1462 [Paenibacillaceae bacterium GAS479]